MSSVIKYNSWKNKAPFGAVPINSKIKFNITKEEKVNINKIEIIILKENEEIKRSKVLSLDNLEYEIECDVFLESGVYFYYFEVEIIDNNNTHIQYYGKDIDDANVKKYDKSEDINKYQITVYEEFDIPSWYKEGILYNIFVDRFNNGNYENKIINPKKNSFIYANWNDEPMYIKDNSGEIIRWDFYGGNLKGIIEKLDYLESLGVSIIYLNPIFEARSNHKYDTGDYKKIDPMFGDERILLELITKASKKNINIILDGVFSHIGADSKYFNKFSTYDDVGAYQSENSKYINWFSFKDYPHDYEGWWGVKDLPNTNELEESFMKYIIYDKDSVINKWVNLGIKGWRLDVADELPTKFIREFKKQLKTIDEDSILIGEVWEDASNKISYDERRSYFQGKELDSVMGYPFRENVLKFLKYNINSKQLINKFMTIKENYPKESFKANLNLISSHDAIRIKTELNENINKVKIAVIIQMMFEGIPYIYYGDEAGLTGGKDPDNRKTYPWGNEDLDMLEFYRNTSKVRKSYKSLYSGETEFIDTLDNDVFAFIRTHEKEKIMILVNRSDNNKSLELKLNCSELIEININNIDTKNNRILKKENDKFNIDMNNIDYKVYILKN